MRTFLILAGCLAGLAANAAAAGMTAFEAVRLLTREQRKLVALVEGRDGTPTPERWYILLHDPTAENGLKECVVAGGAIVASRAISQFAEKITPEMTLWDAVKFDSDKAAKLVQQYAQANAAIAATIGYELRKDGADATPVWTVTGYDVEGRQLGVLVITATRGAVVTHEGFSIEPGKLPVESERFSTFSSNQVSRDRPVDRRSTTTTPTKKPGIFDRLFGGGNRPPAH